MKILLAFNLTLIARYHRFKRIYQRLLEDGHQLLFALSGTRAGEFSSKLSNFVEIKYPSKVEGIKLFSGRDRKERGGSEFRFKEKGGELSLLDDSNYTYLFHILEQNPTFKREVHHFKPDFALVDGEYFVGWWAGMNSIPIVNADPHHLFQFAKFKNIPIPEEKFKKFRNIQEYLRKLPFRTELYLIQHFANTYLVKKKGVKLVCPLLPVELADNLEKLTREEKVVAFVKPHFKEGMFYFSEKEVPTVAFIKPEFRGNSEEEVAESKVIRREDGRQVIRRRRNPQQQSNSKRVFLPPDMPFVSFREQTDPSWAEELLKARAVITDANHHIISWAVLLKKPLLVIPKPEDFTQWIFGQQLETMGVGEVHTKLSKSIVEGFLSRLDLYYRKLEYYNKPQRPDFFEALDRFIRELNRKNRKRRRNTI